MSSREEDGRVKGDRTVNTLPQLIKKNINGVQSCGTGRGSGDVYYFIREQHSCGISRRLTSLIGCLVCDETGQKRSKSNTVKWAVSEATTVESDLKHLGH